VQSCARALPIPKIKIGELEDDGGHVPASAEPNIIEIRDLNVAHHVNEASESASAARYVQRRGATGPFGTQLAAAGFERDVYEKVPRKVPTSRDRERDEHRVDRVPGDPRRALWVWHGNSPVLKVTSRNATPVPRAPAKPGKAHSRPVAGRAVGPWRPLRTGRAIRAALAPAEDIAESPGTVHQLSVVDTVVRFPVEGSERVHDVVEGNRGTIACLPEVRAASIAQASEAQAASTARFSFRPNS